MGERAVLLYDGQCRLCTAGARRLAAWARPDALELADFQKPEVLARFPALTHAQCMEAMHVVEPGGRVRRGADAVVAALLTRGWPYAWVRLYHVPGLRWLIDRAYAWVARNRYRLMGRTGCDDDACAVHFRR